jgi:hypothetical protein
MKNLSNLSGRQVKALLIGGLIFLLAIVGISITIFSNKKKDSNATLAEVVAEIESL